MDEFEYFVSVERALEISLKYPPHLNIESIPLTDILDRTLSKNIPSMITDPPFDNSSMDGFAVKYSDTLNATSDNPLTLDVIGISQAGTASLPSLETGQAIRIMTGARIPTGADSIVLIEEAEAIDDGTKFGKVKLHKKSRPNYIRRAGENMTSGQIMLNKGERMDPFRIGLAATMGYSGLPVYSKVKYSIISTGDELIKPGEELKLGQIYESNSYTLAALIKEMGHEPIVIDAIGDDMTTLREKLDTAAKQSDVIITSGGVSMGEFDLVRKIMEEEGNIKFWRVKMKPGSPPLFGLWKNTPIFGLPGNPISSQLVFLMLIKPWISKLQGGELNCHTIVKAKLTETIKTNQELLVLRRIFVESSPEGMIAKLTLNQGSGNSSSTTISNAVTLIQPGQSANAGDIIDAILIR